MYTIPSLIIKDEIFEEYIKLHREIDSPTGYTIIVKKDNEYLNVEPKSLYAYKENDSIMLQVTGDLKDNKNEEGFVYNITKILKVIDERAASHIYTVLSNPNPSSASLNKQASEMIHFIVSVKGYTDYKEIIKRVDYEFTKVQKKTKNQQIF